jgi:hypothetical protein
MIIIPFRSCRKSTTAAVLGAARKGHAAVAAPLVAALDDDEVGAASAPHIVLKMHLHCASCAAKIERVVMDIPGARARSGILSAGELLILYATYLLIGLVPTVVQGWRRSRRTWGRAGLRPPGRRTRRRWRRASRSGRGGPSRSSGAAGAAPRSEALRRRERHVRRIN